MKPFTESIRYDYPLTPSSLVVDCGGYEGQFAREIHQRYACRVWSFEPVFHAALTERLSDLYPRVRVLPFGLGGRNANVTMRIKGNMTGLFADGEERSAILQDIVETLTEPVAVLKLNCEGSEFEILEALLERGQPSLFTNLQVQFHPVVPDCEERWKRIRDRLLITHELTFDAPWCWENYRLQ